MFLVLYDMGLMETGVSPMYPSIPLLSSSGFETLYVVLFISATSLRMTCWTLRPS